MKKILILSLSVSMIFAGLSVGYYYSIYLPGQNRQETLTPKVFKEGEVTGIEDVPVEVETTPSPTPTGILSTLKTTPTPTSLIIAPTNIPEPEVKTEQVHATDDLTNLLNESKIREAERKASEAENCQRSTETYSNCVENFNRSMDEYADCQERKNNEMQEYNDKMQKYSECINEYNDKLEDYNKCTDPNSVWYSSFCAEPHNSCYKPFPLYPGSCLKPMNWCTKPHCL